MVFVGGITLNYDMKENLMLFTRVLTDVAFITFSMNLPSFKFMRAWFRYSTLWTPNFIDHILFPYRLSECAYYICIQAMGFEAGVLFYVYFILLK